MRRGWKAITSILLVLGVSQVGCWTTGINQDTGASLTEPSMQAQPQVRIVVRTFLQLERQDFDHEITGNLHSWKEADGVRDIGRGVARGLRKAGFERVTYQPDEKGDYYVEGYLERFRSTTGAGMIVWFGLGAGLTLGTCIVPLYFAASGESQVVVSIFDSSGQRLMTRKIPVEYTVHSTCPWGVFARDREFIEESIAGEIVPVLHEAIESHGRSQAFAGATGNRE